VLGAHALRGEVRCRVVTDFPKRRFKRGSSVLVGRQPFTIGTARIQGDLVYLKLDEVADRTAAEKLRGLDVEVPREEALLLPRGQFYWHEVIGLTVEDANTGEPLGEVADILETGANDVYIVRGGAHGEILVPAIKSVVKKIDPAAGRMLIEPLPGLIKDR
jgi:16S rRNA processing protein RimM